MIAQALNVYKTLIGSNVGDIFKDVCPPEIIANVKATVVTQQAPKTSDDKIEKMVKEFKERDQKRKSFSWRRRFRDEKDIDSINDRHEHFNKTKMVSTYSKRQICSVQFCSAFVMQSSVELCLLLDCSFQLISYYFYPAMLLFSVLAAVFKPRWCFGNDYPVNCSAVCILRLQTMASLALDPCYVRCSHSTTLMETLLSLYGTDVVPLIICLVTVFKSTILLVFPRATSVLFSKANAMAEAAL
ncbi:hypothetical protein C3L33_22608, partial [Rhododendron williamsianum]